MKLLMENWKNYLHELENTSDVSMPKKFYISIYFDDEYRPEIVKNLAKNQVVKVPGASSSDIVGFADNPSNFMQFHGNLRDATIVMNSKDFLELNDSVVKIEYDNADFLTQDGLKALYRLVEKNQKDENDAERIMGAILDSDVGGNLRGLMGLIDKELSNSDFFIFQRFLEDYETRKALGKKLYDNLDRINNVEQFVSVIQPTFIEVMNKTQRSYEKEVIEKFISKKDFVRAMLMRGMISTAKFYEKENEWVVDSNVMNVPKSSILYIAGPAVKTKNIFQKMKKKELSPAEMKTLSYEVKKMNAIMAAIEKYDLENKFKKVIITDMGTFNAAKNKWQKRKREMGEYL